MLFLSASFLCPPIASANVFPAKPEWTVDFGSEAIGYPAHFGPIEGTKGILISLRSGRIVLLSPQGERRLTMKLDLPMETSAVAADLRDKGSFSIIGVDAEGSVYCFNEKGEREWKFPRAVKSSEFRLPVFADLDGDGRLEIVVADSRGAMQIIDSTGHLRLQINATKYRISVPAVGDVDGDGKPELIFGTEAGEVYCVNGQGDLVWSTMLDGCFGRALPLIADANQDGNYEVYIPTAFNNAHPGLFSLDAANGRLLWKASSILQSYRSTVVADLDGDGRDKILFGDKNSSLFCVDSRGQQLWKTQLPGRGIFFAPAIAALKGRGTSAAFVVVRGAGDGGKSLYALGAEGKILDALALPGGGGASPILCKFQGRSDLSLIVLSANGELLCYRPQQDPAAARILWPGIRNDGLNTGFIKSAKPTLRKSIPPRANSKLLVIKKSALGGLNKLTLPQRPSGAELVSVKTILPDRNVCLDLIHPEPGTNQVNAAFVATIPGNYDVNIQWHDVAGQASRAGDSSAPRLTARFLYHLDKNFGDDAERVSAELSELKELGRQAPARRELTLYFEEALTASLEQARRTRGGGDFDKLHWKGDYALGLVRACSQNNYSNHVLLHQIVNPWDNFDAAEFFNEMHLSSGSASSEAQVASRTSDDSTVREPAAPDDGRTPVKRHQSARPGRVDVGMLGNEYESAAIALGNLRSRPATYRLWCEPFQAGTNRVEAGQVLSFHEVLSVRPDGTGELTEDPLPLLGEGQTVRLDAGETRKVWLTFRSGALSPGTWRATLKIGDVAASDPPSEFPAIVEVYPVRLPDRFSYRECNWLYLDSISDEAIREATLRDALKHGMNVFVIPGASMQVDEQGHLGQAGSMAHDNLVRKLHGRAFFLVSGPVSVQWPANTHPSAELQDKVFADALRWYGDHMRSLGCDYDDYAIYLQDEPGLLGHDAGFDAFVAQVKRFKAAEPRIQLYANPAGGARAELLRPLQDLIDVWAPDLHLVREQPGELTQLFQHAKHYWHYEAPGDQRYLNPLGFYRMKPWVAFQMGMTGGGYWVYSSSDFWRNELGGGNEYGSVYPTDHGPVTTKRWEASRDGIEDFELVSLIQKTAEKAAPQIRQEALSLVEEAVQFVTHGQNKVTDISRHVRSYTPDYQRWMAYRRQLIRMQMRLEAATPTTGRR